MALRAQVVVQSVLRWGDGGLGWPSHPAVKSTLAVLLCASLVAAASAAPVDTVVVCPPQFREALEPWLQYRRAQGHQLSVLTRFELAADVRSRIREVARGGNLRFLVLVGDAPAKSEQPDRTRQQATVPTHFAKAKVNVRWGSEPEIATDEWFGDLDGDLLSETAIGRLTVDTSDQLAVVVQKIIDCERNPLFGQWRRRVNFVAGVGGFGAIADAVLETATRSFITNGIPPDYKTSMTYASWRSPYFPDPRSFRDVTIGRINEGCLCWVYIGHGHRHGLDWVKVPAGVAPIMNVDDVDLIKSQANSPIAVFLACYTAAFDGQRDCLAARLLVHPAGPVAIIGGTRVTMPYGMSVLSNALMDQMFREQCPTIGEVLLRAKRQLAASEAPSANRQLLDALAKSISPNPDDLEGERREHVLLFHLIGDPLLRLRYPQAVEIQAQRIAHAGQPCNVQCETPVAGECLVEIVCRRGRFTFKPERRTAFDDSHEAMLALSETYRRANDDCWISRRLAVDSGKFRTSLAVPANASGAGHVRVYIRGKDTFAAGSAPILIRRKTPAANDGAGDPVGSADDSKQR